MTSFPDARLQSTSVGSAEALSKPTKSSDKDAKIEKSAKDFEAILLSNWLQQAEESFAKVPGGDDDEEDGATSQFTQMSMQSLGASFAGTGGIGIAKMISAQLHRTEGAAGLATGSAALAVGSASHANPTTKPK